MNASFNRVNSQADKMKPSQAGSKHTIYTRGNEHVMLWRNKKMGASFWAQKKSESFRSSSKESP